METWTPLERDALARSAETPDIPGGCPRRGAAFNALAVWILAAGAIGGCGGARASTPESSSAAASLSGPTVDVYFSIGTDDGAGHTCNYANNSHCDLYKVSVNLAARRITSHAQIRAHVDSAHQGALWPSVNPAGTHVAYAWNMNNAGMALFVKRLGTAGPGYLVLDGTNFMDEHNARYSAWRHDGRLLYSFERFDCLVGDVATPCRDHSEHWDNVWSSSLIFDGAGNLTAAVPASSHFGGDDPTISTSAAAAAPLSSWSFADPNVNPVSRNLVSMHYHVNQDDVGDGLPVVLDSHTSVLYGVDPAINGASGPSALTGCCHTAWNPRGDRILCTEQGTDGTNDAGLMHDEIYAFTRRISVDASGHTVTRYANAEHGPLFTHVSPTDMAAELGFCSHCTKLVHKYAEWCGGENYLVATVFCTRPASSGGDAETVDSRVYLIDITDPAVPIYTDLTTALAGRVGLGTGASSIGSTCANYRSNFAPPPPEFEPAQY